MWQNTDRQFSMILYGIWKSLGSYIKYKRKNKLSSEKGVDWRGKMSCIIAMAFGLNRCFGGEKREQGESKNGGLFSTMTVAVLVE